MVCERCKHYYIDDDGCDSCYNHRTICALLGLPKQPCMEFEEVKKHEC